MRFYFNDYENKVHAPQKFVTTVMTNLESYLYDIGDLIIEKGSDVKGLIFLINGDCQLNGFTEFEYLRKDIRDAIVEGRKIDLEAMDPE